MNFTVLTLFPDILEGFFGTSIMARAVKKGLVSYDLVDIRTFATDKHRKCDDEVFGGGAGMLMKPEPLGAALEAAGAPGARTVYVTPSGRLFNQAMAKDLAKEEKVIIICGRYEGVDQRVIDRYVTDEISIGDYVLSSGEVAALVLVDALYRLVPGVISGESLDEESFGSLPASRAEADGGTGSCGGLLEYPQYTRPAIYDTMRVPEVLSSGHHANIVRWRLRKSLEKTLAYRPELLANADLPEEVRIMLRDIITEGGSHEPHTADSGRTG